jgi:hypothetical protein
MLIDSDRSKQIGKEVRNMKTAVKKMLALALTLVLTVGLAQTPVAAAESSSPTTAVREPVTQAQVTAAANTSGIVVTANVRENGNATVTSVEATKKKTVTISSTVTVDGVKYTVTNIGAKTFANATKATKVVIPKTIKRVNAKAFSSLSKTVKTIQFNTTKAPEIAKTAFKGTSTKNLTIKVSKNMSAKELKKFKAALKKAGFKGTVKKLA